MKNHKPPINLFLFIFTALIFTDVKAELTSEQQRDLEKQVQSLQQENKKLRLKLKQGSSPAPSGLKVEDFKQDYAQTPAAESSGLGSLSPSDKAALDAALEKAKQQIKEQEKALKELDKDF